MWDRHCRARASLWVWPQGSAVAASGLSCCKARGILVPQPGIKPVSPALQGRLLTTGPARRFRPGCFWDRQLRIQAWAGGGLRGGGSKGSLGAWVEASCCSSLWDPESGHLPPLQGCCCWLLLSSRAHRGGRVCWGNGQRRRGGPAWCRERRKVSTCCP